MPVQEGKWNELGMEILLKMTHESRKGDNRAKTIKVRVWPSTVTDPHWSMLCLYSGEIQSIWREQEAGPQSEWSDSQVLCGGHMVWSWVMVLGIFCAPFQICSPPLCPCSAPRKWASVNNILPGFLALSFLMVLANGRGWGEMSGQQEGEVGVSSSLSSSPPGLCLLMLCSCPESPSSNWPGLC